MHPNGQMPAYEWEFGDVNPPVHAWAAWRVYKIEKKRRGTGDRRFLERVLPQAAAELHLVGEPQGRRRATTSSRAASSASTTSACSTAAKPLPTGGLLEQSDGTSWMAMYCLNLLRSRWSWREDNPSYEDVASKFWEHFLYIADAMSKDGGRGIDLWDEQDGFFYDVLHLPDDSRVPLQRPVAGRVDSAVRRRDARAGDHRAILPGFTQRLDWFIDNRPDLTEHAASMSAPGHGERRLLSVVDRDQLRRILEAMLDEGEFLSPHGIRALSRRHMAEPYRFAADGIEYSVAYEPAESRTGLFGGNSNWRGPVWFPVNYLLIEALQKFHHYYGDDFTVECPTGSGMHADAWRGGRGDCRAGCRAVPARTRTAGGRCNGARHAVPRRPALAGPACCSTSTSTATRAPGSAPATRPAGRGWWPSCCSRAASSLGGEGWLC